MRRIEEFRDPLVTKGNLSLEPHMQQLTLHLLLGKIFHFVPSTFRTKPPQLF